MAREIAGQEYREEMGGPVWSALLRNQVEITIHYDEDARWAEILEWVEGDSIAGRYAFSEHKRVQGIEHILFWFTDPDSAFAFRMRWC